jgi:hypothetical protein
MMSVLERISSAQNRKDEEPNKLLAKELIDNHNLDGIQEIVKNLWHKEKHIQSDCDSVLEEIGRTRPDLIQDYVLDFIQLLSCKNNRMVWGSMINLSLIAERKADVIFNHYETLVKVIDQGSVITKDSGILTLSKVASVKPEYNLVIFPFLLDQLRSCRPKSVPQYAESILICVNPSTQTEYLQVLKQRLEKLSTSQQRRVKKILQLFDDE